MADSYFRLLKRDLYTYLYLVFIDKFCFVILQIYIEIIQFPVCYFQTARQFSYEKDSKKLNNYFGIRKFSVATQRDTINSLSHIANNTMRL